MSSMSGTSLSEIGSEPTAWPILERVSDGVICCDANGTITFCNSAAARVLCCPATDAIGHSVDKFFPGFATESIAIAEPTDRTTRALPRHGAPLPVLLSVEQTPSPTGYTFYLIFKPSVESGVFQEDTARLAAIVESSDDAIIGKTLNGIVTSWNDGARRLFGHTAEEMIGQPIARLIPPGRENEEPDILNRLRAGERVDHFETVRVAKNGARVYVSLTISPIRDESGRIVGASKIARDVTDRKLAAAAREEIEQRMRLAVEAARIGIWDWDLRSGRMTVSQQSASIFGIDALTATLDIFEASIHPADRASTCKKLVNAVETGQEYRDEYRVLRSDGSTVWVEARGNVISGGAGNTSRILGTVIDISERKIAQEMIRRAEHRLQMAAEAAKIGFWEWDLVTGKLSRSAIQAELMGLAELESDYNIDGSNIHPDDRESVRLAIERTQRTGEQYVLEFRTIRPDGTVCWLEGRGSAVFSDAHWAVRMHGIVVDISERKQAEEANRLHAAELAHLSRTSTMGNMASALAHELNQPLGAILNYAGVCENIIKSWKLDKTPVLLQALGEVMNETRRAGAIISRLRAFVSKRSATSKPVDLNDVVQQSIKLLDFELRQQAVTVLTDLAPALSPVVVDTIQIEQVMVNLIFNSMQAMSTVDRSQRKVIVQTQSAGAGFVKVLVSDQGVGMSSEQLARLFEPFFTTKPTGMGMGLNISRSIIENHGGRLRGELNASGGMTFYFTLPI